MTAAVRSVQVTHVNGGIGQAARGAAAPGDLLVAFQSADSSNILELSGGWTPLAYLPGGLWPGSNSGTWAGTKVWSTVVGPNEPTSYQASFGPVADGMVTVVAVASAQTGNVVVEAGFNGLPLAPSAIPAVASGLQLRYGAGVPNAPTGASVTWAPPAGYTERADGQGDTWTTVTLVSAPIVSTATVEQVLLSPSPALSAVHAFTVLIASTEQPVPDPPVVQPYAPARGSSAYRFVFTRLRDRTYLGDLDLINVTFDKRILQAGSFSATIPIPNRRIGDQVAEIIPRDETVLDRGPGVITCQIYREGEPWGEYWITKAQPSRSRRNTPAISLTGSTLDALLGRIEIQDDLFYAGDDQIDIARGLLDHMQGQPGANLSLSLQPGTSGIVRDRTYLESETSTYGQRLIELAQVDDGFEWMINLELVDGVLVRTWVWGHATLGQSDPPPHLFADGKSGGDILEWGEEIDALRGATRWRARGSTASTDASTTSTPLVSTVHTATAHLAAGWPRLDRTLNYSTVTDAGTLEDYAAFWAARAAGALRVDQVTVALGKNPSLSPNNLGDTGRFYYDNEWHRGVWRTRRIIGISITPPSRSDGKEEARLVLEGQEAPGA